MKKELFYGILIGISLFFLLSYKTTDSSNIWKNSTGTNVNLPLKQRRVIVIKDKIKVDKYINIGFICEDADIAHNGTIYYTLVLY